MPRPKENQKPVAKGQELSGAEKERRKRKKAEEDKHQAEQMKKFIIKSARTGIPCSNISESNSLETENNIFEVNEGEEINQKDIETQG